MPSIWCPKCQYNKNKSEKCPICGFTEEDQSKTYNIPKPKKARTINGNTKKETITLNKNTILIIAIVVIAISVSYLAINKYKENRANEKIMEMFIGTSDPDEIEKMIKNQNLQAKKMIQKMKKQSEEAMKNIKETQKNMFKTN